MNELAKLGYLVTDEYVIDGKCWLICTQEGAIASNLKVTVGKNGSNRWYERKLIS